MYIPTTIATLACLVSGGLSASLWQDRTPQTLQPYALKKNHGLALVGGEMTIYFPVTGNSSGDVFSLMPTVGPGSGGPNAFPHVHKGTYETFYTSKGRIQMWAQNNQSFVESTSEQTTRIMMQGDFCGIPNNTIHMFQFLEPDTQLSAVLVPGTFERFFFSEAVIPTANVTAPQNATALAPYDVFPQTSFTPIFDLVDNKAGAGNWHDEPNEPTLDDKNPIWVAKDWGVKFLHTKDGVSQITSPLLNSQQTNSVFTQGTITMSQKPEAVVASDVTSPHVTAFLMEEGQIAVTVDGFDTAHLIDGDVLFVPANTTFSYYAEADFTKFMYFSGGNNGLDAMLIADSVEWSSAYYPRELAANTRRGFKL